VGNGVAGRPEDGREDEHRCAGDEQNLAEQDGSLPYAEWALHLIPLRGVPTYYITFSLQNQ
jgi:hypothetical protein